MPAVLPGRERTPLGRGLQPPAGGGGSGDPRPGPAGVLLRHCHQADPRPAWGPEAEAASGPDHHCAGSLLLRVLAALRSGHLRGHSAAPGGPAPRLQAGGRPGRVAGGGGAHGVCTLLPEPAAVRLPGGRVQELGPQSPHAEPSLQLEDFTPKTSRSLHDHGVGVLQSALQLVTRIVNMCLKGGLRK